MNYLKLETTNLEIPSKYFPPAKLKGFDFFQDLVKIKVTLSLEDKPGSNTIKLLGWTMLEEGKETNLIEALWTRI